LAVFCTALQAQTAVQETLVVTGVYEPIPLDEADRSVRVLMQNDADKILSATPFDFLRLDPSLDVRGRSPNGVQTDLSIRGSNFGQTLILVDGLRMNDAQSGHHNLDVPVPADALASIEILKGAGSAFYGSDAIGGVVNFITREPEASELRLRAAVGNFGVNQQSGSLILVGANLSQEFSFSRDFSSGFRADRDYRNLYLFSRTHLKTRLGITDLTLATNDRPFGADQFYGNFNSWERTRSWFAAIRQRFNARTEASFGFRRHTDLFVLFRDQPQIFTNRHAVESYESSLRRRDPLAKTVSLNYGGEAYRDVIDSNNLGSHQRNRGAAYMALDVRAIKRFSFTVGAREEIYGGGARQLNPTASAGYWISPHFKLRASASRAFRLPTYTDLYYHDPANVGSPYLKPERAWSFDGALEWTKSDRIRGEIGVFHRRERNGIDYVRNSPEDIYRATNFDSLNFTGVEADLKFQPFKTQWIEASYSGLHGAQDALHGLESKYIFNYPTHNASLSWQAVFSNGFLARTRVGVLSRFAREPYALWDVYLADRRGRWTPFAQLTNISNTSYEEIPGVVMPGRAAVAGIEWRSRR
jgi:iron complex outermembrane receptor protein